MTTYLEFIAQVYCINDHNYLISCNFCDNNFLLPDSITLHEVQGQTVQTLKVSLIQKSAPLKLSKSRSTSPHRLIADSVYINDNPKENVNCRFCCLKWLLFMLNSKLLGELVPEYTVFYI